jgi:hypothetical protein
MFRLVKDKLLELLRVTRSSTPTPYFNNAQQSCAAQHNIDYITPRSSVAAHVKVRCWNGALRRATAPIAHL